MPGEVTPVRLLRSEERGEISGEGDDRWDPVVREREGERCGLGRLGAVWAGWPPGCGPVGLLASFLLFFFLLLFFSFVLNFCFEF
jgi:hypothetical protein